MKKQDIIIGLFAALFLAVFLSPFASQWPDGLEKVAEEKGFIEKSEVDPAINSPVPDYSWPGIKSEKLATSVAGVAGTLIVFLVGYGIAALLKKETT